MTRNRPEPIGPEGKWRGAARAELIRKGHERTGEAWEPSRSDQNRHDLIRQSWDRSERNGKSPDLRSKGGESRGVEHDTKWQGVAGHGGGIALIRVAAIRHGTHELSIGEVKNRREMDSIGIAWELCSNDLEMHGKPTMSLGFDIN